MTKEEVYQSEGQRRALPSVLSYRSAAICCRAIEKGGSRWELLRKQKLLLMAPLWGARGAKRASEKLVKSVLEGNAWQADHIVPVYQGGGLCDLDNFRTLCTVCHLVRNPTLLSLLPSLLETRGEFFSIIIAERKAES